IIGVNVMVALRDYEEIVKACVDAGADLIISGAGLPMDLPELVSESGTRIAPIVSSGRALSVISRRWKKKYDYVPDMVVVEGPKAGGHLGFKPDQLSSPSSSLETVTADVLDITRTLEPPGEKIPVIAVGGVFDGADISRFLRLGADGVQMATRFVTTEECDASLPYKMAYINADESDAVIISSPVGMPGRAIRNRFVERATSVKQSISRCYNCIKTCHVTDAPYCITKVLIDAVRGDVENGLIFCGSNVGRIREIVSVKALMERLEKEYSLAEQAAGCS
ncbi:MAG: nitronate monooxygenase family protein, partial [Clostridiales bacterium]|nr:nitronate monooxygenase family protein [Clostridiales bacterium]